MHDLLVVMSNPIDGRDEDYNDWYTNVHIRDVMRAPGAIAVQRFYLSGDQLPHSENQQTTHSRYLALYETYDMEKLSYAHRHVFTPAMMVSDAIDLSHPDDYYYRPLAVRQNHVTGLYSGDLLIEQLAPSGDPKALVAEYADKRLPAILGLPGVEAGLFAVAAEHQMVPSSPDLPYVAIYRLSDRKAALSAWNRAGFDQPPRTARTPIVASVFEPLIDRLTADEAIHPSAVSAAAEALARETIGDRFYDGCPSSLILLVPEMAETS